MINKLWIYLSKHALGFVVFCFKLLYWEFLRSCGFIWFNYVCGLWRQKQVSQAWMSNWILRDVITFPCLRYLLLAPKSSYLRRNCFNGTEAFVSWSQCQLINCGPVTPHGSRSTLAHQDIALTEPLRESMLTYPQWGILTFNIDHFRSLCSRYHYLA